MRGTRIVIERDGLAAIAAPLVASWIAGELLAFPSAVPTLTGSRIEIDLTSVPPDDRPRLTAALSHALREPRFDGWLVRAQ